MKIIKQENGKTYAKLNKKDAEIVKSYLNSDVYSISECYGNGGSHLKNLAEKEIREVMNENNGFGYRITGFNHNTFSAAWCYFDEENDLNLVYETRDNRRTFTILTADEFGAGTRYGWENIITEKIA